MGPFKKSPIVVINIVGVIGKNVSLNTWVLEIVKKSIFERHLNIDNSKDELYTHLIGVLSIKPNEQSDVQFMRGK